MRQRVCIILSFVIEGFWGYQGRFWRELLINYFIYVFGVEVRLRVQIGLEFILLIVLFFNFFLKRRNFIINVKR